MSILDDVVVNAKSAVDLVGKKAEKIVDYSKIKYTISSVNSEISKKFEALGRFVYDASNSNETPEESIIKEKFDEITQLQKQLDVAKEMLAAAKNKKVCPLCGQENDKDSIFCCKCGNKFSEETAADAAKEEPATEEPTEYSEQPASEE